MLRLAKTRRPRGRRQQAVVVALFSAGLAYVIFGSQAAAPNPLAGLSMYRLPNDPATAQATAWRNSRPADAAQIDKIATNPKGYWMGGWNNDPAADARSYTQAAAASGQIGQIVVYNIPFRDCGQYSAGGANDGNAYRSWVNKLASGLGGRKTIVILEPDGLGLLTNCLNGAQQAERLSMLSDAVNALSSQGGIVYIEASTWISTSDMANRLRSAGVGKAAGFAVNVSGFNSTASMQDYGDDLSGKLGGAHYVIDTSRNGLGPWQSNDPETWCNPPGRALGIAPTTNTGRSNLDAYLWIKRPGESDGTCRGGPSAGAWWADYALGLAQRSNIQVGGTTPTPQPTPAPTPPQTPQATPVVSVLNPGTYDDTAAAYSGTWLIGPGADKYNGSDHYSLTSGSTATLSFTGASVQVYGARAASHGLMAASVDGGAETIVDTFAANRADTALLYQSPGLADGRHTVRIRVTGQKQSASSGTSVGLDKFVVSASAPASEPVNADLTGDGKVTVADMSVLLGQWNKPGSADLNGDGVVGIADLSILLGQWTK